MALIEAHLIHFSNTTNFDLDSQQNLISPYQQTHDLCSPYEETRENVTTCTTTHHTHPTRLNLILTHSPKTSPSLLDSFFDPILCQYLVTSSEIYLHYHWLSLLQTEKFKSKNKKSPLILFSTSFPPAPSFFFFNLKTIWGQRAPWQRNPMNVHHHHHQS